MNDIELFESQRQAYTTVTPEQAKQLLEAKEGALLFIGRESCPYCRRFSTKLYDLVKSHQLEVNFLHSQKVDTLDKVQALREQYGVKTVPGFLVASPEGVKVKCDSSMSPEEILAFAGKA